MIYIYYYIYTYIIYIYILYIYILYIYEPVNLTLAAVTWKLGKRQNQTSSPTQNHGETSMSFKTTG